MPPAKNKKRKRSKGKSKGNAFEREISRMLSMWWTDNARDDVFYRSQSSGARATTRSAANLSTAGQYGDICATDPVGKPLIDKIIFELKCGYNNNHLHALVDELPHSAITVWDGWVTQLIDMCKQSGVPHWMIIHRRSGRNIMIWSPKELFRQFPRDVRKCYPLMRLRRYFWKNHETSIAVDMVGIPLKEFFYAVPPVWFEERIK